MTLHFIASLVLSSVIMLLFMFGNVVGNDKGNLSQQSEDVNQCVNRNIEEVIKICGQRCVKRSKILTVPIQPY